MTIYIYDDKGTLSQLDRAFNVSHYYFSVKTLKIGTSIITT